MTVRPVWFVAVIGLGTGCEQVGQFLPKVRFDGLDVRTIDWEEADVDFVFAIDNPNPVSIGLASFSYDLNLEEVDFLSGDNPDGFQLKAEGSAPLVLPLDLRYADIWNTIEATRGEDVVDFLLSGGMGFDTPAGNIQLPYNEDGGFPALRTPKFTFQAVRVNARRGFGVVDVEVDLGVDNEHGSSLFFDAFDYGLSLNDKRVANGIVDTFSVDGATTGTVTLPIALDLLTAGTELFDVLISGGRVDLGLDATVDVDTPFGIVPLSIDETGNLKVEL
ncbi:MAG: LEA type 2 family protein [Myxococcota bacterium]